MYQHCGRNKGFSYKHFKFREVGRKFCGFKFACEYLFQFCLGIYTTALIRGISRNINKHYICKMTTGKSNQFENLFIIHVILNNEYRVIKIALIIISRRI